MAISESVTVRYQIRLRSDWALVKTWGRSVTDPDEARRVLARARAEAPGSDWYVVEITTITTTETLDW